MEVRLLLLDWSIFDYNYNVKRAIQGAYQLSQGRRGSCGGGRQRPVPGHLRASWFNRHPQMRLTPGHPESTHCQECFRNPPTLHIASPRTQTVCVFITAGPITKLFAGGEEESGGHVL
jgi:hypothetical protein